MNSRTGKTTSLLSQLQKTDPEKAEEIAKKLTEARNASEQLNASEVDQNAERRAAALEKIQRIKEQLKALRMLRASDPKATARQAARLSRELASAVKEYAAANGGKAPGGISVAGPAASGASQQVQAENASPTGATTTNVTNSEAAAQPAAPPAPVAEAVPETTAETENTGEAVTAEVEPESPEEIREEEQERREEEQFSPAPSGNPGRTANNFSLSDPHAAFKDLVRSVEDEIKKILELAKFHLRQQEDRGLRRDIEDTEKSLGEIEQALSALPGPGITLSAAPPVTSPAAPVNVLA